ncbi:hypothetical protein TRSC58_07608 [Trypanosoma rangeli SC58]|uniref:Uncharacterized protein n=1 Tax=Trypanosoma rangeli SC58 TaxID=429131 RepID=A0A061ISI7_TRYRA|nr:hypothetical protein TRSC58_07608 [Trypanosoma rangeli SC58]
MVVEAASTGDMDAFFLALTRTHIYTLFRFFFACCRCWCCWPLSASLRETSVCGGKDGVCKDITLLVISPACWLFCCLRVLAFASPSFFFFCSVGAGFIFFLVATRQSVYMFIHLLGLGGGVGLCHSLQLSCRGGTRRREFTAQTGFILRGNLSTGK